MRTTVFALGLVLVGCANDKRRMEAFGDGGNTYEDAAVDTGPPIDTLPCGQLIATFRDFDAADNDFEDALGDDRGLVETMLGPNNKPVYAGPNNGTLTTKNPASFNAWYNATPTYDQPITFTEGPPGTFTFIDPDFFPLDTIPGAEITMGHNFHFTTEIHGTFTYRGGELFTFSGDDDVFIFVNKHLAIDLGGVHAEQSANIDFDARAAEFGITKGGTYQFDAFHAERHTSESNFKMTTTIDCFVIF